MKLKIKKIFYHLGIIIISVFLFFTIQLAMASWVEPTAIPPNNNVSTPLNISSIGQVKEGPLILNTGNYPLGLAIANGTVGIGTINPVAKLSINGSASATGRIFDIKNTQGEQFVVLDDGRVAIGTSTPTEKLTIMGSLLGTGSFEAPAITAGSAGINQLNADNNVNFSKNLESSNLTVGQNVLLQDQLAVVGNSYFAQPVGIGTNKPSEKLEIFNDSAGSVARLRLSGVVSGNQGPALELKKNNGPHIVKIKIFTDINKNFLIGYDRNVHHFVLQQNGNFSSFNQSSCSYTFCAYGSIQAKNYYSADGTLGISTVSRTGTSTSLCDITIKNGLVTNTAGNCY